MLSYSLVDDALTVSGEDFARLCRLAAGLKDEGLLLDINDAVARERLEKNDSTFANELTPEEIKETQTRLGVGVSAAIADTEAENSKNAHR